MFSIVPPSAIFIREEAASKIITNEEATFKLRAAEMERQFELKTKEANDQRLRDEYNLQQRLWDLEQQSRTYLSQRSYSLIRIAAAGAYPERRMCIQRQFTIQIRE